MKWHKKSCTQKRLVTIIQIHSKTSNDIKPVENINKNPQSFLKKSLMQKDVPPSYIMQNHTYEQFCCPYKFKKDNPYRESIRINRVFESIEFV